MRFRSRSTRPPGVQRASSAGRRTRILQDLARLGVADEVRDELSRRLDALAPHLSSEAYDAALAGVVLAHGLHRDGAQLQRRNLHELEEIQRLLAGFSDELRKVDEALRILCAYVSRMRTRATPSGARTVH